METVIREGALRLLTAESTCDVILSCQGRRLMAHKVMLSMVSPVFRNLLLEDSTDPTVIILPDISSHTMSLILDYIYTGTVIVYSNTIQQFLSLAKLFKIKLDIESPKIDYPKIEAKHEDENKNIFYDNEQIDEKFHAKRNKKVPELIPIHKMKSLERLRNRRKMNSCLLPSPWRPRIERVFNDPRDDMMDNPEYLAPTLHVNHPKPFEHDPNNNFQHPLAARYYHQPSTNARKSELNQADNTTTSTNIFSHSNRQTSNGIYTTTISRPPEEVAIDRDKNVEKETVDNWTGPDLVKCRASKPYGYSDNPIISNNRLPVPEVEHSTFRDCADEEQFKDDSNGSSQNVDCAYLSAPDKDQNYSRREQEISVSEKGKPFKCEQCGKCFSQLRNFKYHRSVHEGTKEFAAKCSECGKIFNDKGYLSSHMKIHRDKKEYACPHCPKRFNQRVAYNMHTRIHTGLKPHECPTCGKSFSRKMLLKQHQRVHTGERPYSCPECGKTFADRSNMSLHARLHTGVKPYACNLCPKSFTKKHHLKTHMNFHTGLKPYTCEKCGLAFSQSSNMRTHYKKCLLKTPNTESDRQHDEEENKNSP